MSRSLFSPESLDAHFAGLSPDVRLLLQQLERRESWTWRFEEFLELFQKTSSALPLVVESPVSEYSRQVLDILIPILAAMPIGQCLTGISYLDSRSRPAGQPGWGVALYHEAVGRQGEADNPDLAISAKTIVERVHVILRTPLAAQLFTHIRPTS